MNIQEERYAVTTGGRDSMYYHTRAKFSEEDFQFITATVSRGTGEERAVRTLLADTESLSELLHDIRLFERVMRVPPFLLAISPHLFFYLFVYRALEGKGIQDDDLADYIAGVCTEFWLSKTLWQFQSRGEGKTIYFVDLLKLADELEREPQFRLRCTIGNISLFLTGLFPDFIYNRSIVKAAPGFGYYESIGRTQYDVAAGQASTFESDSAAVLSMLAEQFVMIRTAMNIYADLYLRLSSSRFSLQKLDRQAATLDTESFRMVIGG